MPGDFPGEEPQKTQILIGLVPLMVDLATVEFGFSGERGCGVWFSGVPFCAPKAGDAPPDAIANMFFPEVHGTLGQYGM